MISINDFRYRQLVFFFSSHGDSISFRNDNIVIKDNDGKIKLQTTCYQLFILFIIGSTSVTTGVLEKAKKFGFSVVFLSESFRIYAAFNCQADGNVLLRRCQYLYKGYEIGAKIISNKVANQRCTLMAIRSKDEELKDVITRLKEIEAELRERTFYSCQEIMGLEGIASRLYFREMYKGYSWTARRPRVKHDEINCLLDIGYTHLFCFVDALLNMYGFDTYEGVLHRPFFHRKSLTCDIVEPFRPIIDRAIRKAGNLGMVKHDDFYINQEQYTLFGKKAVPYLRLISDAIMSEKEDIFQYIQDYYRTFCRGTYLESFPEYKI